MYTVAEKIEELKQALNEKMEAAINKGTKLDSVLLVKLITEYPLGICGKIVEAVQSGKSTFADACIENNSTNY